MKILFLLGDDNAPERKLAEETQKLIGKDATVVWHNASSPMPEGDFDGVWIFTHEKEGGCPPELMQFAEQNFERLKDIPTLASGVGGKEGGMNAVTEISDYFIEHGGRYMEDSEPLCIPLRTARFELEGEERMELFFLVDEFLTYCGMDDSESRRIAFGKVVSDYFSLMKYLSPTGPKPTVRQIGEEGVVTDVGNFDCALPQNAPPELRELPFEIDALVSDYEIGEDELLPALQEKIEREW